jgi:hypothetical protein
VSFFRVHPLLSTYLFSWCLTEYNVWQEARHCVDYSSVIVWTNWSQQEESAFARLLMVEQIELDWFNMGTVAKLQAANKVSFYLDLIHFSQTFL